MTNRITAAFDSIHAEDSLKEKTLVFLRAEINNKRKPTSNAPHKRFAASFAMLLCIISITVFSYNFYFKETAYIDVDVNPSIEISVNRMDRVIGAYAYNSDGARVLEDLDIMHRNYKDAIRSILDLFAQKGYLQDDGLVSVTLQTDDSVKESKMLFGLSNYVKTYIDAHHGSVQADIFPVSGEMRSHAHELDLSPAKYLAILELQELDPTATVENCRGHTIAELKILARTHGGGHHAESNGNKNSGGAGNEDIYMPYTQPHHRESTGHGGHG